MTVPRPKVYLLSGCPFSMRLHVFLTEAGLADEVEIITVQHQTDVHRDLFAAVERVGLEASFPMVEAEPGQFEIDSLAVIDRMSREHAIDSASLPLLRFYNQGMLPRYGKMFMELKRLKGAAWDGAL